MLKASQARKQADDRIAEIRRNHEKQFKETKAKESKRIEGLWSQRRDALITQIEGYITKAAAKGNDNTWEPTDINPNGDDIIYLTKIDQPLKDKLMEYFRGNGFKVVDYEYGGLKITWERDN